MFVSDLLCLATTTLTLFTRICVCHLFNTVNYLCNDKYMAIKQIGELQKQYDTENADLYHGLYLHAGVSLVLYAFFPDMFFNTNNTLYCVVHTLCYHVVVVEPLYYVAHRLLHIKEVYIRMHSVHHSSVVTNPSTSIHQNFDEHCLYVAIFGPAILLPHFLNHCQNWKTILVYLVAFDIVNALGHSNFQFPEWYYKHPFLKYIFYVPETHEIHHKFLTKNYSLFMPIFDLIGGTYTERPYHKRIQYTDTLDFAFIGHCACLSNFTRMPEFNIYNTYKPYNLRLLPHIALDLELCRLLSWFTRCFYYITQQQDFVYELPAFLMFNRSLSISPSSSGAAAATTAKVGKVVAINASPLDYIQNRVHVHNRINSNIIQYIRKQHIRYGTKYFGLGNLNKNKNLNDCGRQIVDMLSNENVVVLTGDTCTTACIYHSLLALCNKVDSFSTMSTTTADTTTTTISSSPQQRIFFIGGTGKIGCAVSQLLVNRNGFELTIYSRSRSRFDEIAACMIDADKRHLLKYSDDIKDMHNFENLVVGRLLTHAEIAEFNKVVKDTNIYDYNVPFVPLANNKSKHILHKRIGVLRCGNRSMFQGAYDISFGLPQHQLYSCYCGVLLGVLNERETNEVGEIVIGDIDKTWEEVGRHGFELVAP